MTIGDQMEVIVVDMIEEVVEAKAVEVIPGEAALIATTMTEAMIVMIEEILAAMTTLTCGQLCDPTQTMTIEVVAASTDVVAVEDAVVVEAVAEAADVETNPSWLEITIVMIEEVETP